MFGETVESGHRAGSLNGELNDTDTGNSTNGDVVLGPLSWVFKLLFLCLLCMIHVLYFIVVSQLCW